MIIQLFFGKKSHTYINLQAKYPYANICFGERRGDLMVSALAKGSRPGRRHSVVFLGKTVDSDSASLHPGV